jgi:hypothetical protein
MAPAFPVTRSARELPEPLVDLAVRTRSTALAGEALLPLAPALTELFGTPGLRRGSTVVVHGGGVPGATSLLLGLLSGPSASGAWCAVVGAPELGLVAAGELGVALERLVLVPEPGRRLVPVAGALLEGCDVVCLRCPASLAAPEARRLAARARERKVVLIVATGGAASLVLPSTAASSAGATAGRRPAVSMAKGWFEAPDVALYVSGSRFIGAGRGSGRIRAHLVEVVARRRRSAPEEVRRWLWLPGENGQLAIATDEPVGYSATPDLLHTGTT